MVEFDLKGWKDCLQQRQLEHEIVQIGKWFEVGGYDGDGDDVPDSGVDDCCCCYYYSSHDSCPDN